MVVSGTMIHVHMAAVFTEETPTGSSTITGGVDQLYPHGQHFKGWKKEQQQLARRARRDAELAARTAAHDTVKPPEHRQ